MTTYNDIERSTTVPFWFRPENRHRPDNPVKEMIAMGPGSILDFGRPVDLVCDGRERFPREDEQ